MLTQSSCRITGCFRLRSVYLLIHFCLEYNQICYLQNHNKHELTTVVATILVQRRTEESSSEVTGATCQGCGISNTFQAHLGVIIVNIEASDQVD